MREPLLLPVSALAGGILIAHFYFFELPDLYVPVALALAAVGLAFTSAKSQSLRLPTVCALMVVAGMVTQVIHRHTKTPVMNAEDNETVLVSGCVTNPPVFSPAREQFTLEIAPKAAARITVNLKNNAQLPLRYGQTVEVAAKIRTPHNFGNPDAFDYAGYLASQHIYWTGSVSSPADIRTVPGKCGS
ncbi:MAG TPA: ComEC/Rec2 family competence protein, partial [Bryobacteraceae bacterium]